MNEFNEYDDQVIILIVSPPKGEGVGGILNQILFGWIHLLDKLSAA